MSDLPHYDRTRTYNWNYENAPEPVEIDVPQMLGEWTYGGLPVDSPLGMPAGPLLNGKWCLYYASLGFDVLTYKTVRSCEHACYAMPNLQPVACGQLGNAQVQAGQDQLLASETMEGSWAVAFGMPSKPPGHWQDDIEITRTKLAKEKLLSVSVVGTMQDGWGIEELANDYAKCAKWAVESGADTIEINLSCPNVNTCDGQLYQHPHDAVIVSEAVHRAIGTKPLIVKIGHEDSKESASQLIEALAPYISTIATTNCIAATVRKPSGELLFDGNKRGICGAAIQNATYAQVKLLANIIQEQSLNIEVIGVGGISTPEHVKMYLDAGANSVQIATGAMLNPMTAIEIKRSFSS